MAIKLRRSKPIPKRAALTKMRIKKIKKLKKKKIKKITLLIIIENGLSSKTKLGIRREKERNKEKRPIRPDADNSRKENNMKILWTKSRDNGKLKEQKKRKRKKQLGLQLIKKVGRNFIRPQK